MHMLKPHTTANFDVFHSVCHLSCLRTFIFIFIHSVIQSFIQSSIHPFYHSIIYYFLIIEARLLPIMWSCFSCATVKMFHILSVPTKNKKRRKKKNPTTNIIFDSISVVCNIHRLQQQNSHSITSYSVIANSSVTDQPTDLLRAAVAPSHSMSQDLIKDHLILISFALSFHIAYAFASKFGEIHFVSHSLSASFTLHSETFYESYSWFSGWTPSREASTA